MTYEDIFIYGWSLNLMMFFINLFIGIKSMNSKSRDQLLKENKILSQLKYEFDRYYPYRKYETMVSYFFPFTAFFKGSYRLLEMRMFFNKNEEASLFDYMIYKYENDINIAKNKLD